jgi:hypothetical protein
MEYRCKICNKEYSSYQSLWIHNKKYHKPTDFQSNPNVIPTSIQCHPNVIPTSTISCNYCGKIFKFRQGKSKHQKNCKIKNNEKIQEQLDEMKKQLLQIVKKECKIHPKTFNKINKQLNINNTQINDNKVINNNIIIQLGKEKLYEVFTKEEQIKVLNQGYMCLDYLVQYAHFNPKYPQFKNILITNLQNNIAYKYNITTNNFDVISKNELLNEIISERMYDINEFFENYKDDITIRMQKNIQDFIAKMDGGPYEQDKMKDIKIILYNNKDKVDINKHKETSDNIIL